MSKYYKPFARYEDVDYEVDPDAETMVCCPVCGDPSDYCMDHNHWLCDDCEEPLEIGYNDKDEPVWECEYCDY